MQKQVLSVLDQREVLGKQVKIYGTKDEPLFLAKDVAGWIEHSQPDVLCKAVDDDEKVKLNSVQVDGRTGGNGKPVVTGRGQVYIIEKLRKDFNLTKKGE